jgi:hypothetical protein
MDNYYKDGVPTREEAELILKEAEKLNPGPWVQHSRYVAQGASLIAQETHDLDPELGYILGLLHDIGRREGRYGMRHGLDGYKYIVSKGYELVGRICLSHIAFKYNNQVITVGKWDGTKEEHDFVIEYLSKADDMDYDKLIKLCDYISLPSGFCLMEKRIVEMALRGGINEYSVPRWKSTLEIQKYFEDKMGKSIYSILPRVVENTFEI